MTETWNPLNPIITNQVANDIPDVEENFDYLMACHGYWVDSSEADQASAGSGNSVKDLVDAIGGTKRATLFFKHHAVDGNTTTYTFSDDETITSNIDIVVMNGARLTVANAKTLTINGSVTAGNYQIFAGAGNVTFGSGAIDALNPIWIGSTGTLTPGIPITIAADDVTPTVTTGSYFVTSANTGATAITDFDNGYNGQVIVVVGGSNTNSSTIADSGNFVLAGAITLGLNVSITLIQTGGTWKEISRSRPTLLADADKDTKIQVEEAADEDIIRFDIAGTEQLTIQDGKIEATTDNDVSLGTGAKQFKNLHISGNVFENTAKGEPTSGNQTLTAAMLLGGIVDEDPEGAANWTTDTAANIVAAITGCVVGVTFRCVLHNDATAASGEVVTLVAGSGVTLHGVTVTMTEGTNEIMELVFRVTNVTGASEAVDCYILTHA